MPGIVEPEPVATGDTPPVELPVDETPPRPYVVFTQNVDIDVDFYNKRIHGRSHILIVPTTDISEVFIDARQCEIDVTQITVSNCEVKASYCDPCDRAQTPKHYRWSAPQWGIRKNRMGPLLHHRRKEVSALDHDLKCCTPLNGSIRVQLPSVDEVLQKNRDSHKSDQQDLLLHTDGTIGGYRISIPFKLRNVCDGLHFVGIDDTDTRYPHVYTRHSIEPGTASAIFPCIDDPGSRNSWRVSVTFPRTLGDAFHKPLASQQQPGGVSAVNGSRKRKHGEDEPRQRSIALTEEDKLLEMTVVCSGYLTGEVINKDDETKKTMTFEVDKNKAAKHIGFAVGPFEHIDLWSEFRSEEDDTKLGANAVKVHGYCLPGRAEEVRNTCAALVTAVDHLVLTFGRYPFESYKICFVDDMIEDTIPLCAFSLCSTRLLYPQDIVDTEVDTTRTLVYSLASQWFGVNIVPNTKGDIWLVVGIAWFMTDHFIKALCGNNEFRFRMKSMADRLVEVDIRRPSLQEIGEHLYLGSFEVDFMNLKAPLVLFILDRRLSKSSGTASISKIISRMVSKANTSGQASDEVLGSDAFRKACEKTGNTRLEHFWNQWVVMSGCPRFDVFQRFNKKRLCVEMTIRQTQDIAFLKGRPLNKNDFWRNVMEVNHAAHAAELQQSFTGPMTIRIHEADGTPYEHIVEIREDAAKSVKFEIPYNTKYKRLKRNRRQRERALASSNAKGTEETQRDLYYLGDVMQHPDEIEDWDFRDWDEETETKMDQESYEWIRMDADLEWLCDMQTNLPPYMYASQLQQDRDVVAQQDSMLFLHRSFSKTGPHPLVSTILTRTLLDPRYYYGIRVMAANELPRHAANEHVNWIGLRHLLKAFQHFFCHPGTYTPKPNDFSDKRQYLVQCVIPEAIARIRGEDGKCPKEARRFILEQLQANDNTGNVYSDHLYICRLIKALAICQIPDEKKTKQQMSMSLSFEDAEDDEMGDVVDSEPEEFRDLALEEVERYRRMDQYSPSYQNCFTIAALDAFCHLMKAKVIPLNPVMFVQYLQDKTYDLVRIKACESLVELGLLGNLSFLRFFLTLVSTDSSPFVRDQLFKALCRGLAGIAIGENEQSDKHAPKQSTEDGLIVEQDNAIMEEKQKAKARREDLSAALAALKAETTDDENLQAAVWKAMDSPVLTIAERINILELCSILFEEDQSLIVKLKYPTYWTVERGEKSRQRCLVMFKEHFRTKSRKPHATQPLPPKPEPKRTITLNLNRGMSFSAKATTPSAIQPPPAPAAPTPKPSDAIRSPKPAAPSVKQTPIPKEKLKEQPKEKPKEQPKEKPREKPREKPKEKPKEKLKEKPKEKPKEKLSAPALKQPSTAQGPKERTPLKQAKQSVTVAMSRGATPSGPQEKPKGSEYREGSISIHFSESGERPTVEPPPSELKIGAPKVNGNGNPAPGKLSRPLKRASTESDGPRPTKVVKLDTSKIPRKELEILGKRSNRKLLVKLKFSSWHKLRRRKDAAQAGSIRATPKHRKPEEAAGSSQRPPAAAAPPLPKKVSVPASSRLSFPQKQSSPSSSSSQPAPQAQPSATSGKPRKPLPDTRKPLPSAAPIALPSKPPSASPPTPKGPPKFKIKLKPPPT
ncbi:Transcription initiation factor TFIID subunit 2 [Parahypoxylon ruwenzoriense]